jgi:hypothetical protein
MRRLLLVWTAAGLLGALGCHHTHGRCDCDDSWGCHSVFGCGVRGDCHNGHNGYDHAAHPGHIITSKVQKAEPEATVAK